MDFESVSESANYLLGKTKIRPKIAVICGSGLGSLGELIEDGADIFSYSEIPNFPVSTAPGHKSRLLFGLLKGVPVLLMQGRFHMYEGYSVQTCAMPVRVMKLVGVKCIIVTNAAGGLNQEKLKIGDFMIINDHINIPGFSGVNPLAGPNDQRFGSRFLALSDVYGKDLINIGFDAATEVGIENQVHEGVYTMLGGPTFETPAELRMLKLCGVDAVGMSTVHEAITARHCDIRVFAFSLITNVCVTGNATERLNKNNNNQPIKNDDIEKEVFEAAKTREEDLAKFVTKIITKIDLLLKVNTQQKR